MPDPLRAFHRVGFWYPFDLPSPSIASVLKHLLLPGSPRLFVLEKDGRMSASVSNSATRPGFGTRVSMERMIMNRWIARDPQWRGRHAPNVRVYRITETGTEALAQFHARKRFQRESIQLAKRILAECRAAARARR